MPRKINWEYYQEIYDYLNDNHTYKETKEKFDISEMQISRIKKKMKDRNLLTKEINKIKPNDVEIESITEDLTKVTLKPKAKISTTPKTKGISLKELGYSTTPKTKIPTTPSYSIRRVIGVFDTLFNKAPKNSTKKEITKELIIELQLEYLKIKDRSSKLEREC